MLPGEAQHERSEFLQARLNELRVLFELGQLTTSGPYQSLSGDEWAEAYWARAELAAIEGRRLELAPDGWGRYSSDRAGSCGVKPFAD